MEEIVIKNKSNHPRSFDGVVKRTSIGISIGDGRKNNTVWDDNEARQLADAIYKLLGISITDLQRQAFEAGRVTKLRKDKSGIDWEYQSFDDYENREKQ